ncbi:type I-E CRISPR-associated protein Cse1/CasA [Tuanshanicoccus lijuaniae]|uniref:type I-E CRISPR-associated protein Cse1/CasA n=1 Tax=Aerococcaceae bacterium zg-1292 TaxID=2774330 RepID=UPI00193875D6|nr:type I-E CRISPR-associated protein Cse1/CasA [Aerococcaceae bacterium zg-1292]QQA36602.1 type I-E CRISPR-associated protein Cse1/CasA [Aerococcaceae bacterium zg-1292]
MGRFNLTSEPWISVIVNEQGESKLVSLKELFANAHHYIELGGDTKTQDFAVLRVLLSVLHTVFSRFDATGSAYDYFRMDEKFLPESEIVDSIEYEECLMETWQELWNQGYFPEIVIKYLEKWESRFYLFDEEYPFFQVTASDISEDKISKSKASSVSGKNINRLISESNNKVALFSPKFDQKNNKEILAADEIARWLITFQGYTGLSDKVIFGKDKYKASKGWLFDLGGLYLAGSNLFETLMLNLFLLHPERNIVMKHQKPSWEFSAEEKMKAISSIIPIDNLAELYTSWSRAIYIDPQTNIKKPFSFEIVKLPDLLHEDHFIEPMTVWKYNTVGDAKDRYTPKKHQLNQSMWRNFGLIALPTEEKQNQHQPGIIQWLNLIKNRIGSYQLSIIGISMKDDANATSWVPVDEIYDQLTISNLILTDIQENQWVTQIYDAVEKTKKVINFTYRSFLQDINEIRHSNNNGFIDEKVMELFYYIDQPFREWLLSIKVDDAKEAKVFEWYQSLYKLIREIASSLLENASIRDYTGVVVGEKPNESIKNIATAHNKFMYFLKKDLEVEQNEK